MTANQLSAVRLTILQGNKPVDCMGRVQWDSEGPYADSITTIDGTPVEQAVIRLKSEFLRRRPDPINGADCYYHAGYAI